ncbi:MAG: hypothetical protein ACM3NN_15840 [Nitrospirota bacterium]
MAPQAHPPVIVFIIYLSNDEVFLTSHPLNAATLYRGGASDSNAPEARRNSGGAYIIYETARKQRF